MNLINNLRRCHCFVSSRTRRITGGKITTFKLEHPGLTVVYNGACSPNVSFRISWISFGALPCREKKKSWWQLASRCCWNRAPRLTCFLLASVRRKDLQFGSWTGPSFQLHYRFHPAISESRSGWGIINTPSSILSMCLEPKVPIKKRAYVVLYCHLLSGSL